MREARRARWLAQARWIVVGTIAGCALLTGGFLAGQQLPQVSFATPPQAPPAGSPPPPDPVDAVLNGTEKYAEIRYASDPPALAGVLLSVAGERFEHGNYKDAEHLQRRAIGLLRTSLGPAAGQTLAARYALVRTLDMTRQNDKAARELYAADGDAKPLLKAASKLTMFARAVRGGHAVVQTDPGAAQRSYEEAEALRKQVAPDDPAWLCGIHSGLAWSEVRTNHSRQALNYLADLTAAPEKLGRYCWLKAQVLKGIALRNLERYSQAEQVLVNATQQSEHDSGSSIATAIALYFLGTTYEAEGKLPEASVTYGRTDEMLAHADVDQSSLPLELHATQAALDLRISPGNHRQALARLVAAHDGLVDLLGPAAAETQLASYRLADAYCANGQVEEARPLVEKLSLEKLAAADASERWPLRMALLTSQIGANCSQLMLRRGSVSDARNFQAIRSWESLKARQHLEHRAPPAIGCGHPHCARAGGR